jgi:lysophospholipase L1-like esterase
MKGPIVPANGAKQIKLGYVCFDGVHPNDLGYDLMGNYIDLSLFDNQGEWNNGHGKGK